MGIYDADCDCVRADERFICKCANIEMGRKMRAAGFRPARHSMCCYVLCGYDGDSFEDAEKRLTQTMQAGFVPYAMLFRGEDGKYDSEWRRFQREWCCPIITGKKFNEFWKETT